MWQSGLAFRRLDNARAFFFFGFCIELLACVSIPAFADHPITARWDSDRATAPRTLCPFEGAEPCRTNSQLRPADNRFAEDEQFVDPVSFGAIGDGAADDTAAVLAAESRALAIGVPLRLSKNYRMTTSQSLASDVDFEGGKIIVNDGSVVTINGKISARNTAHLFVGSVAVPKAPFVSVAWWGALVNADAAPAFRAAVGGNRTYFVPPGTYTLSSYVKDCLPGATIGPEIMINFCNMSNFHIKAYGAVINTAPNAIGGYTEVMMLQADTNFSVEGGTWQGSVSSGDITTKYTCVAAIFNSNGFTFKNMHLTKRYTQGFVGDFDKNGLFINIQIDATGMGFDLAYQQNVSFDHISATGLNSDGTTTPGRSMISLISDPPNLPYRMESFGAFTKNISVSNSTGSKFAFTYIIADGQQYRFRNNTSNGTDTSYDYYVATSSGLGVGLITIKGAVSKGFRSSVYFVTGPLGRNQYFDYINISDSTFWNDIVAIDVDDVGDAKKVKNLKLGANLSLRGNRTNMAEKIMAIQRSLKSP